MTPTQDELENELPDSALTEKQDTPQPENRAAASTQAPEAATEQPAAEPLEESAPQAQPTRPAPVRRRPKKKKARFPVPEFLKHLGEDVRWYYDIRIWSPLILLLLILALIPGRGKKVPEETVPETTAAETVATEDTTPTEEPEIPEAAALARLADSVGYGRSDNVKTVIMWVAINRSEDRANGYGQSLLDEIARPNQWQGYNENGDYSDSTYEIAKQVLEIQATGGLRPVDSDMLWLVLNDDGSVTLRNQFTASANQKWREKTVR